MSEKAYIDHCGTCSKFFPIADDCPHRLWLAKHKACHKYINRLLPNTPDPKTKGSAE